MILSFPPEIFKVFLQIIGSYFQFFILFFHETIFKVFPLIKEFKDWRR